MRITYDVSLDDMAAYSAYLAKKASVWRSQHRLLRWGFPWLAGLLVIAICRLLGDESVMPYFAALIGVLVAIAAYPRFIESRTENALLRCVRRNLVKLYANDHKEMPDRYELEIVEDAVTERSVRGERKAFLSSITEVSAVGDRTFICLGRAEAFILPRQAIVEGDYDAFLGELNRVLRGRDE